MGNCFWCFLRQLFYLYLFLNAKTEECNILTVILVQGCCPLKTEIARFPLRFRLNVYLRALNLKRLLVSIPNAQAVLI